MICQRRLYGLLFASFCLPLLGTVLPPSFSAGTSAKAPQRTFRNPLKQDGADPFLMWHKGWYYLASTTARDVRLRRARHMGELKDAPDQVVWKDETPDRSRDIWAPEFHRIDTGDGSGPHWYLYFTASDGKADGHHRMFVVRSAGDDPMGPYTFLAKVKTDPDDAQYAIDGTTFQTANGTRYFVWCGRPSSTGQGLYISRMTDPATTTGPRTYLNADGFGCAFVREGPAVLQHGGKVFLIYSVCGADTPDYKLGMLVADAGSDLTSETSWKQYPTTVFARVDQRGVFGPGHNSFFTSPDGKEDWITYHAKSGTAVRYSDRSARTQRFTWKPDGTPDFGLPLSVDTDIPVPSGEPK